MKAGFIDDQQYIENDFSKSAKRLGTIFTYDAQINQRILRKHISCNDVGGHVISIKKKDSYFYSVL